MTAAGSRGARTAGVLFVSLLFAGCAAGPELRDARTGDQPVRAMLDDVPFYAQEDMQCGPASLAMVLNANGMDVTVEELGPAVFVPGRQGSVQPEMLAAARRYGAVSYPVGGSLENLLAEIDAGHPVIVLQNVGISAWPIWHYAVVIGYDLERAELVLHSGTKAQARMHIRRFDRTWARSGRWAMAALPPGTLPTSVDRRTAVDSAASFERVGDSGQALVTWQAVVNRWPDYSLAWFALGNAFHVNGEATQAAAAFHNAALLEPDLGAAWLNLGLTLEQLGEGPAALEALRFAVDSDGPWRRDAERALARVESAVRAGPVL